MRKRMLAAFLAAATAAGMLAGCADNGGSSAEPSSGGETQSSQTSQSSSTGEQVKLSFWFAGSGPERTALYNQVVEDFNASQSGIAVEGSFVSVDDLADKVNVAIAGGGLPDVTSVTESMMAGTFIQKAFLELDERFAAWEESAQFDESSLQAVRLKTSDNKLYALPTTTNITGIWYRKDVFQEKGIPDITTWEDFFSACEKLTTTDENGNKVYGHTLRGGSGSTNQLLYEIVSYVGQPEFFNEEGQAVLLRDPLTVEFVTKTANLFQNGYTPESSLTASFNEMVADFNSETAMTMVHNLGSYENQKATFSDDQYGFIAFPVGPTGKLATIVPSVDGISIAATTAYPDEAWEFLKFYANEKNTSDINQGTGQLPTRLDSLQEEWVTTAPHLSQLPAFFEADKYTVLIPSYLPDYSDIQKTFAEPAFQEVLAGQRDPAEFVNEWAERFEAAYAEYQAGTASMNENS